MMRWIRVTIPVPCRCSRITSRRRRDVMPRQAIVDLANRSLIASLLPVDPFVRPAWASPAAVPGCAASQSTPGCVSDELPLVMRE